ncbi:MarR family EPS-associated transcriptional regulator [Gammaproteobacteria bacterium]|nr:MarR family EPS-associated transcriptional regulator [Gammaproteobacteria bacterium]|tara:strand:+ start:170 stop:544 length:375 start_codon:yes stop_codon:yes gene_type:complete
MTSKHNKEEYKYEDLDLLRHLQEKQDVSQRELAQKMGISLGKINFILNALIKKGIIKVQNFRNNKNKLAYTYYLTSAGINEKAVLTVKFFKRKLNDYDILKRELAELEEDMKKINASETKVHDE